MGHLGRGIDERRLTHLLAAHARALGVPGAVVGVLAAGRVEVACYGLADVSTGRPVRPDTPFSLGSLTKPVVATLVAGLVKRRLLSYDDTLAEVLPEASHAAWARTTTIRQLLANRSGIALSDDLEFGFDARTDHDDEALGRFAAEIVARSPGPDVWSYSNAGWCLLGRAVEVASGMTFERAATTALSDAGVRAIRFACEGLVPDRVAGHMLSEHGPTPVPPLINHVYAAAGTIATGTAHGLLELARWHLRDHALAELRETAATISLPGWLDGWGLGWGRFTWSEGPAWGWDGMVPGERVCLRLMPEHDAAVVLHANADNGRALARRLLPELMDVAFGLGVPREHVDRAPGATLNLSRYGGVYAWPDRRVEVTVEGDGLRIAAAGQEIRARPVDGRTFALVPTADDGPFMTFDGFDGNGRPNVLYDLLWAMPRSLTSS